MIHQLGEFAGVELFPSISNTARATAEDLMEIAAEAAHRASRQPRGNPVAKRMQHPPQCGVGAVPIPQLQFAIDRIEPCVGLRDSVIQRSDICCAGRGW